MFSAPMKAEQSSFSAAEMNVHSSKPTARNGKYSDMSCENSRAYRIPMVPIMIAMLIVSQNGPSVERR